MLLTIDFSFYIILILNFLFPFNLTINQRIYFIARRFNKLFRLLDKTIFPSQKLNQIFSFKVQQFHYSKIQFKMKNLQKKQKVLKSEEQLPLQEESYEGTQKQPELHFFNKLLKNDSLFVTFSGLIEGGVIQNCQQLTLFYTFATGPDWKIVAGKQSGISQIAGTDGNKIVWNLPFEIAYETTYLSGWPQLIVILYGTDFFGRSFVEGYGNIHLPMGSGVQKRKIRVFKPLAQSIISGIFGYLGGTIAQYKDPKKVLSLGEGRQVTRVCTQGEIDLKIETTKHNFKRFGYQ